MENVSAVLAQSKRKKLRNKIITHSLWYVLYAALAVVLLFPVAFMVTKSLMTGTEAASLPVKFWPDNPTLENYRRIFTEGNYMRYTANTLIIVVFNMIAIPLSASVVAYGFAKTKFAGKNVLFVAMLSTIMLPSMVVQIPQFAMFSSFGWINTYFPMTIPNLFGGGAMNVFLLRQFMRGIPNELDNAAKIDGANAFQRYLIITLPLCVPILIYVMITVFNTYWSDFFGPLMYLKTEAKYTLAIGIFRDSIQNSSVSNVPVRMAAGVFMTLFPAVLFFIFQKQLIEGVTVGSIKG